MTNFWSDVAPGSSPAHSWFLNCCLALNDGDESTFAWRGPVADITCVSMRSCSNTGSKTFPVGSFSGRPWAPPSIHKGLVGISCLTLPCVTELWLSQEVCHSLRRKWDREMHIRPLWPSAWKPAVQFCACSLADENWSRRSWCNCCNVIELQTKAKDRGDLNRSFIAINEYIN